MATALHRVLLFTFLRNGGAAVTFVYFSANQIAGLHFAETGILPVLLRCVVYVLADQFAMTGVLPVLLGWIVLAFYGPRFGGFSFRYGFTFHYF